MQYQQHYNTEGSSTWENSYSRPNRIYKHQHFNEHFQCNIPTLDETVEWSWKYNTGNGNKEVKQQQRNMTGKLHEDANRLPTTQRNSLIDK